VNCKENGYNFKTRGKNKPLYWGLCSFPHPLPAYGGTVPYNKQYLTTNSPLQQTTSAAFQFHHAPTLWDQNEIGNIILKLALHKSDVFAYDFTTDVREWRHETSNFIKQQTCTGQLIPYKLHKYGPGKFRSIPLPTKRHFRKFYMRNFQRKTSCWVSDNAGVYIFSENIGAVSKF
jgi:hypothetical protein